MEEMRKEGARKSKAGCLRAVVKLYCEEGSDDRWG
jgi:hypothetical protein